MKNTKFKKENFYKIIYISLVTVSIISLILPIIILRINGNTYNTTIPLTNIAIYYRFFTGNKNQMIIGISIHNIAIATLGFLLSFFSRGILGLLVLFSNSFIVGIVLYDTHTGLTILFALLEFLGMCVAVFGGTILSEQRVSCSMPLNKLFKAGLTIISCMCILYVVAAFIESGLLLG